LTWREKEIVDHVSELKHDIIRECLLMLGIYNGVEILTFADVPGVGSGLGSSAATTVAVLNALYCLIGVQRAPDSLMVDACVVELGRLGKDGGRQDQFIATHGGLRRLRFSKGKISEVIDFRTDESKSFAFSKHFLLFQPTGTVGRDSDSLLSKRKGSDGFGLSCIRLCEKWRDDWHSRDSIESLIESSWAHGQLKLNEFPGFLTKEEVDCLNTISHTWKLCGAGGTGHLLVGTTLENRPLYKEAFEKAWGPELPFTFTSEGAKVVHTE